MIVKDMTIQDIWDAYRQTLDEVDEQILKDLSSPVPQIPAIGRYLVCGGKRLRPFLVILGAEISGYTGKYTKVLGSVIETIHTASLLHDDIVDDAVVRRGKPAAHSVWGNEVIVLVGDFMYSNALRIAVSLKSQKIMDTLSEATTRMTEAELLQLSRIGDPSIVEDDYMQIVRGKTAALISAACRMGPILSKGPSWQEEALAGFGLKLGIAFQIADDLLDYKAAEDKLGKSLGKDLAEGKITLPVIYLLREANPSEHSRVSSIIASDTLEESDLDYIMGLFNKYGTLETSLARAREIMEEAKAMLSDFPPSRAKDSLLAIADYALYREH